MDWRRYAVGGAAARPDSFTGLDPAFARSVYDLTTAAHEAGYPLQITSAYRSPEVQERLYQSALQRYGSEAAARKWVAPPGRSQHNHGRAVDYAIDGSLLRDANHPAAQWLAENASNYGVHIPMSWEPWQVEMAGSRGGGIPTAGRREDDEDDEDRMAGIPHSPGMPRAAGLGDEVGAGVPLYKRLEEGQETPEGMVNVFGTGHALNRAGLGRALMVLGQGIGRF